MNSRKFSKYMKPLSFIINLILIGLCLYYIPPKNIFIVSFFSILTALFFAQVISFFLPKKDQVLIALFVLLFFLTNYLAGFNLVNNVLLGAFIVGIKLLLK